MYLLKHKHFSEYTLNAFLKEPHTKTFQRLHLLKLIKEYVKPTDVVADIGAHSYFDILLASGARTQFIIDPYNGAEGCGLSSIPKLPYPCALFRCQIGIDSKIIPDNLFHVTFSCSVLEHIGQAESGYDCSPTCNPPYVQEVIRRRFCREMFRIIKPGGLTIHTVDHAARNHSFRRNFESAGFSVVSFSDETIYTVEEALLAPDAVRQRVCW